MTAQRKAQARRFLTLLVCSTVRRWEKTGYNYGNLLDKISELQMKLEK